MGGLEVSQLPLVCRQATTDDTIGRIQPERFLEAGASLFQAVLHDKDTTQVGQESRVIGSQFHRQAEFGFCALQVSRLRQTHASVGMRLRLGNSLGGQSMGKKAQSQEGNHKSK